MIVCRIEFGSHLYGTNTPSSDRDYKGVYIPEPRDILLQRVKSSTGHKVVRPEGERNTSQDVDDENYSLQEYLKLLSEGQTVAIDMLFAPNPIETSWLWEHIKDNKERLLTKKSASFVGYCRTQANKYGIKGSRVAAAKAAMEFFGVWNKVDPLEKVGYVCEENHISNDSALANEHTRIYTKETTQGHFETYFECCNRSVGFKNTVKEAYNIYKRIYDEYGKRARMAEANDGVDFKALSHAVRVGYEAMELLQYHTVTFPLINKEHILDIKQGRLTYKEVAEEIEQLLVEVEKLSAISTLRDEPDYQWIDDLVVQVYGTQVLNQFKQRG